MHCIASSLRHWLAGIWEVSLEFSLALGSLFFHQPVEMRLLYITWARLRWLVTALGGFLFERLARAGLKVTHTSEVDMGWIQLFSR